MRVSNSSVVACGVLALGGVVFSDSRCGDATLGGVVHSGSWCGDSALLCSCIKLACCSILFGGPFGFRLSGTSSCRSVSFGAATAGSG